VQFVVLEPRSGLGLVRSLKDGRVVTGVEGQGGAGAGGQFRFTADTAALDRVGFTEPLEVAGQAAVEGVVDVGVTGVGQQERGVSGQARRQSGVAVGVVLAGGGEELLQGRLVRKALEVVQNLERQDTPVVLDQGLGGAGRGRDAFSNVGRARDAVERGRVLWSAQR